MSRCRPPERSRHLRQLLRRLVRPSLFGSIRRLEPLSDDFGYDRGTPIDRYYIERFLARHRSDVKGRVLEVKEPLYTRQFGTAVDRSDVLDLDTRNPAATLVADLTAADDVPSDAFDCFILTQTLQYIYALDPAVRHAHRVLRPSGVLLASVPTVSRLADLPGVAPDYWRFTAAACARLFGDTFGSQHVTVQAHGNLRACTAFLSGAAAEELTRRDLEHDDARFALLVTVRAVKRR